MDSGHYSLYTDVLRGNINLEEQLFGVFENSPMLVQDSPLNNEVATSKIKTTHGINFSLEKDKLLVATWLNTSVDLVYGNEQHKTKFYGKVAKYFKDHKTDSTCSQTSRWEVINREIVKFCGSLAEIEAKNESGTTIEMNAERPMCKCPNSAVVLYAVLVTAAVLSPWVVLLFVNCLIYDDSDKDEIIIKLLTGSTSQRKWRRYIDCNHLAGHKGLYDDYFAEEPVYPHKVFRRRFRIRHSLFLQILSMVEAHEPYFIQKRNNTKKLGLSPLQKMTTALRMLAYGITTDFMGEYVRIVESTAMMSLEKFVAVVVAIFIEGYLRSPNNEDIARLLAHGQNRGFPSMSNNDINVLERSHVFSELAQGRDPTVNYSINGHDYTMRYYFADDIYPKWSTFVKTIPFPLEAKRKIFAKAQEAYRKDVKSAFGVLQA
ncbi:uncharacterized protein LOC142634623 [Castanea sativa]|uniref:uncharacterized protein LOC142634623 n=1 Tax=Castanea sativa TaxID=21020 RepID=UPI003F652996